MTGQPLREVLEATGFLFQGDPAPGVLLGMDARSVRHGRSFDPDASWRGPSALTVYFKYEDSLPPNERVSTWQREIWNEGFAPLLWVISPDRIDLYNGFGRPTESLDPTEHRLETFRHLREELDAADQLAGRLAMETGEFWRQERRVHRKTAVDHQLLSDLAYLEGDLVAAGLGRPAAQALIGQVIFTQYLIDRRIVDEERLLEISDEPNLREVLRRPQATARLFSWLGETFNGDMFSPRVTIAAEAQHLERLADFLSAIDPATGQRSLFPYQFDVIPVELISLIYEQFAQATGEATDQRRMSIEASAQGIHYTRLPVVSLVLDEVMRDLTGSETVLDLTCGSGVFLVEALRRLVCLRAGGKAPSRDLVRSTLHSQIYGVDISDAAIRVAAFSLYLAALELDPDPRPLDALRFEPLIGNTLHVGDARTIDLGRTFDVIVGNPPWTFRGREGTAERRAASMDGAPQPRGESLDFLHLAIRFGHDGTRFGMLLSAMPFFSGSSTGSRAAAEIVELLAPVTLVNLANHRGWLFSKANMPAVVLFSRHRPQKTDHITVVQIPWTPAGPKTHTFEITPRNVKKVRVADFTAFPVSMKCGAVGGGRDQLLLQKLLSGSRSLGNHLETMGAELRDGLILGRPPNRTRDATDLVGLDYLETNGLLPFSLPKALPAFKHSSAQWPRDRFIYRAPLLLIKETIAISRSLLGGPRPIVAVAEQDVVFTDAYFGISFPQEKRELAHLLSGILSSSLASWFLVMTASEFGVWKQRLLLKDITRIPVPDIGVELKAPEARRVLEVVARLREGPSDPRPVVEELDSAVSALYGLDSEEEIVIGGGLTRASWEWERGRLDSVQPAEIEADLKPYAHAFMSVVDGWLSARRLRRMTAEIFELPTKAPLRIVRFALEDGVGPSSTRVNRPSGDLRQLLKEIGDRMDVRLASAVVGQRELRVHGQSEVIVVKPAARRHWMAVTGLEDADAVVSESMMGRRS